MEQIIANLLRGGVLLSALVVVAGGVLYLLRHGAEHPNYGVFHGEPADLRSLRGIAGDVLLLHSRGVIEMGILFLLATPVARVAFSLYGFLRQRDHMYAIVTLIVLILLLLSLAGVIR
jgi:uncharacterized membrane protein